MKKLIAIIAASAAIAAASTVAACPTMTTYGYCTCGMCGGSSVSGGCSVGYQDRTGEGYYDSMGHYCVYGGYWDSGCWIQTVGYWEGGEWCPAEYDPMLDCGYYDEGGTYHSYYGGGCSTAGSGYGYGGYGCQDLPCGYQYSEADTWACDDREWLDAQGYGCGGYGYGYEGCGYGYGEYAYGYEDCGYGYEGYGDCYIDVDLDADTISIVNNGIIVLSGTCTCTSVYRGRELSFGDQLCAGIWNQCSEGFYGQACGYPVDRVCCH